MKRWIVLGFACLLVLGCSSVGERSERPYSDTIARVVSGISTAVAYRDAPIRIRFAEPVEDREKLLAGARIVEFDPSIRFRLDWEDSRTLAATPEEPLRPGFEYAGSVDIARIVGDPSLEAPFEFRFVAVGNEITDLDIATETGPAGAYRLRGTVTFSQPVRVAEAKRAFSLRSGRRSWDVQVSADGERSRTYSVASEPIRRARNGRDIEFRADAAPLGLERPVSKTFLIPAAGSFSVTAVEPVDGDARSGYRIELSDEVDPEQELSGLIRVRPEVDAGIRAAGREVFLFGDFEPGGRYTILVSSSLRSTEGETSGADRRFEVVAPNLEPVVEYLSAGVFMPSANRNTLGFRSLNVRSVRLRVVRVFENNLGQFLQTESLTASRRRTNYFNSTYLNRVGVVIVDRELAIGERRNVWIVNGIDLSDVFDGRPKGLYVISLRYGQDDIIAAPPDYYYRYWESTIYKPVVATDIGITYKRSGEDHLVFVTDLLDARPLAGVDVSLRTYQNQVVGRSVTDRRGFVSFSDVPDEVFYVVAEDAEQRSVVKLNEMAWNLSSFNTGGVEVDESGTRGFVYTERGVYRPGDEIHLSVVLRNSDGAFPDSHPISIDWYNPRGQLVGEYDTTDGVDGFYSLLLSTEPTDPTGAWRVEIEAGGARLSHVVRVETIVPNRLKVLVEPLRDTLTRADREIGFRIRSTYLFGAPAARLQAEATVTIEHARRSFERYPGFLFDNESVRFASIRRQVFRGALSEDGTAEVVASLPSFARAPSALQATVTARVYEKGGRPNVRTERIPVEPYDRYVGLRKPETPYGYVRMGNEMSVGYILVDTSGRPVPGRTLTYGIYRNESYWWWEYDSRQEFRLHYKSDTNTTLIAEGTLVTSDTPGSFTFRPEEWGEYYVEVSDPDAAGHSAGFFFRSSWWGALPAESDEASILAVRTDKERYYVGDTARITFPSPPSGRVLLTVEHVSGILATRVVELDGAEETVVPIGVDESMVPNVYVSLSLIQPHRQTLNDRPIRLYGVAPLPVEDPATHLPVRIRVGERLEPNMPFTVEVSTDDRRRAQFTLAVVDEGLLDLTRFATPDPWAAFHRKQRLTVRTFDLFSHVIGANDGDFFNVYSIGGGYDQGILTGGDEEKNRFEPVSLFAGPIRTDNDGRARVTFDMPNYMGSVRIMAVAADGKAYGSAERTVPVKKDLLVLPSFPRVLGPEESFRIPVTVFALTDDLGPVTVTVDVEGPAGIEGESSRTIAFPQAGEEDIVFDARTEAAVGVLRFVVRASSERAEATAEVSIPLRAASPRVSERSVAMVERGETVILEVPGGGIAGTNEALVSVARRPDLDIDHRLRRLIRYPYGCVEQTTSAVFPQLFLSDFLGDSSDVDVDDNVNAGIRRLRRFQLGSGAFSFWPGSTAASVWGTNYAGHFLLEAKRLGYYVPVDMLAAWTRFQTSRALSTVDGLMERVYRVYLLALAGKPSIAAMNLLLEASLPDMNDTMRRLLANAYLLRGMDDTARRILAEAGTDVRRYERPGATYGSALRDRAMILESAVLFGRWAEAHDLFAAISTSLSGESWYSTQATGYALMAMGKFIRANAAGADAPRLAGSIRVADGRIVPFDTDAIRFAAPVTEAVGGRVAVTLDAGADVERAWVTLETRRVPLRSTTRPEARNLSVSVGWYDEGGGPVNPAKVVQGASFWGVIRAGKLIDREINELALVQIIPSGWEIENQRLTGETLPAFLASDEINRAEYVDIRDDRIMWFFDLDRSERRREFAFKVNAVTVGAFHLPPTVFEAMYDGAFYASRPGRDVEVRPR